MKSKPISLRLKEAEEALGASTDTLAFILDMSLDMCQRYKRKQFDNTWSIKQERIIEKLNSIDLEIEKKILLLKRVLRTYQQQKNGKKTVKISNSNTRNLNTKASNN